MLVLGSHYQHGHQRRSHKSHQQIDARIPGRLIDEIRITETEATESSTQSWVRGDEERHDLQVRGASVDARPFI